MIVFKKFGKTVRISNRHWKSLRSRFNPDNAKKDNGQEQFTISRPCLLCHEHEDCERCGFEVFKRGEISGCTIFLKRLLRNKVAFCAGNIDEVWWETRDNDKARRQLKRTQKLMDEIEAQQ